MVVQRGQVTRRLSRPRPVVTGGRLDAQGLHGLALIALTDPKSDGVAVAVAPALGVGGFPDSPPLISLDGQLPLVVGLPLGRHQLLVGRSCRSGASRRTRGGPVRIGGNAALAQAVLGVRWHGP